MDQSGLSVPSGPGKGPFRIQFSRFIFDLHLLNCNTNYKVPPGQILAKWENNIIKYIKSFLETAEAVNHVSRNYRVIPLPITAEGFLVCLYKTRYPF